MPVENARVDTTFVGYILIAVALLVLCVYGLELGGLFGDWYYKSAEAVQGASLLNLPITDITAGYAVGIIAIVLAFLAVFAYRVGAKSSTAVFSTLAATFGIMCGVFFNSDKEVMENGGWFLGMAFAVGLVLVAIYLFMDRAPKLVAILVLLIAITVFFFALYDVFYMGFEWAEAGEAGSGLWFITSGDINAAKAVGIVGGVFGFVGFLFSSYLALSYAVPRARLPLF